MVAVSVRFDVPGLLGPVPASGTMVWTPTRRRVAGGAVVLPAPFQVYVSAGAASVEVAPSGPDWAWRVDEIFAGLPQRTVYLAVPNVPGPVAYADLVAVDPVSLAPDAEPVAAWWARADAVDVTAAEAKATADKVAFDAAAGVFDGAPGLPGPAGPAAVFPSYPRGPSGWSLLGPGSSATNSFIAYEVLVTPFYFPSSVTVSQFAMEVTASGTAAGIPFGRYAVVGGALVLQETFGTFGNSFGIRTIAGNWTLPAGLVWLGAMSNGGSSTWRINNSAFFGAPGPVPIAGPANVANSYNSVWKLDSAAGGGLLPANMGAPAFNVSAALRLAALIA